MRSQWDFVTPVPWSAASCDIVFIRDLDGPVSVTNDAENVLAFIQQQWPGKRVVYQGTDGEWMEIVPVHTRTGVYARFDPWHGVVWDQLRKVHE